MMFTGFKTLVYPHFQVKPKYLQQYHINSQMSTFLYCLKRGMVAVTLPHQHKLMTTKSITK